MKINLSEIRIDGGTQSRVELNQDVVAEYADAYSTGKRMPDVSLFFDGSVYWLADGFHRYFGAKKAGKVSIDAESRDGTQRDAWLYSLGANADHGLQRTNADKKKAVLAAFTDAELGLWTARQIAEACAVSHTFVNKLRDEAEAARSGNVSKKHNISPISGNKNAPTPDALLQEAPKSAASASGHMEQDDDIPPASEPQAPDEPPVDEDEEATQAAIVAAQDAAEYAMFRADDRNQHAIKRIRELTAEVATLKTVRDGLMRTNAELVKDLSYWKRKAQAVKDGGLHD